MSDPAPESTASPLRIIAARSGRSSSCLVWSRWARPGPSQRADLRLLGDIGLAWLAECRHHEQLPRCPQTANGGCGRGPTAAVWWPLDRRVLLLGLVEFLLELLAVDVDFLL